MKKILKLILIFIIMVWGGSQTTSFCQMGLTNQTPTILADVPPNHWAREAVEKLINEGWLEAYPDNAFRGDMVITRYELAQILLKILERLENIEQLISSNFKELKIPSSKTEKGEELSAEDVELLKKLIKEFEPELKAMGKLEKKITKIEKDVSKLDKEVKKQKRDVKKDMKMLEIDIKSLKKSIEDIRAEQSRILWSGEAKLFMENTDYDGKWESKSTAGQSFDERYDYSTFNARDDFLLRLKAQPKLPAKTDRKIEINAEFRTRRYLGSPYNYPYLRLGETPLDPDDPYAVETTSLSPESLEDLNVGDFGMEYSAPRTKFLNLRGGNVSVAWSLYSLSLTGFKFQGVKASGLISRHTIEVVASRLKKPTWITTKGLTGDEKQYPQPQEFLYGASLLTTYAGSNILRVSYVRNYKDRDNYLVDVYKKENIGGKDYFIVLDESERDTVLKDYKVDDIKTYTVYTRYNILPTLFCMGEYSLSEYQKFLPKYIVEPLDPKEVQPEKWGSEELKLTTNPHTPIESVKDSALFLEMDYNKRGLTSLLFYTRQNPDYHNRYGGIMGLLSSFGGSSLSVGGFDISSILKGLHVYGTNTTFSPSWAKGLTLKTAVVFGGELKPSPLKDVIEDFGVKGLTDALNERKNLLKLKVAFPGFDYKPTYKTTLNADIVMVDAGIDKDDIWSAKGGGGGPWMGMDLTDGEGICVTSHYFQDAEGKVIGVNVDSTNPDNEYVCELEDIGTGVYTCKEGTKKYVRLSEGESIYLELPGTMGDYGWLDVWESDPSGNFILWPSKDKISLARIALQRLELRFKFLMPHFKITHQFSSKLKYEFEWKRMIIKIPVGYFNGISLKGAIEPETWHSSTEIHQHISYQLYRNVVLDFYYNIDKYKDFPGYPLKHTYKRGYTKFQMSITF